MDGGENDTVACLSPATADTPTGAPGADTGTITAEGTEEAEEPAELMATTVNVTVEPLTRPVTTIGEDEPVADWPVEAVTRYETIAAPPFEVGGVKETIA